MTCFCFQAIRNNDKAIISKQARNYCFLSFNLSESRIDCCVFISCIFKFNNNKRNPINKKNNIRSFVIPFSIIVN